MVIDLIVLHSIYIYNTFQNIERTQILLDDPLRVNTVFGYYIDYKGNPSHT